ncbi:collagen alpha-1(XXI) chain-like [Pocillopora damicornis]|uniref:collagen alpha-1(XXI) chain-like n=1 Tax=Pocillopora damicornis TaxID=46731 RepID=UPI000F55122F|nr:collagen alpha-1(XXI) chain-like [Pocillopora damicornis]
MDVAFIMDSSGSIKRAEFYEERLLVKKLVVQVTATGNREALILFGSSASVKAQLGQYDTAEKYIEVVQKLRKKNGRTRIDRALNVAVDEVFSSARPYAYKIVIVLSDGVQSKGAKSLRESSRPLRQANVRVLAVGIGTGMAKNRLRLMTGSDDDVVDVKDIEGHLQYIITNIYRNPCGAVQAANNFPSSTPVTKECVDHPLYTSFCERKATEHMCWAHADFMDIYCPKSCERCG